MVYKIKSKKCKKVSLERIVKLSDKQKTMILHKHVQNEKYPKYSWFYGKKHKELLDKMNSEEKKELKEIEHGLYTGVVISSASGISGALGLAFGGESAISFMLGIPVRVYSGAFAGLGILLSQGMKVGLDERREFLKKMHEKYKGE